MSPLLCRRLVWVRCERLFLISLFLRPAITIFCASPFLFLSKVVLLGYVGHVFACMPLTSSIHLVGDWPRLQVGAFTGPSFKKISCPNFPVIRQSCDMTSKLSFKTCNALDHIAYFRLGSYPDFCFRVIQSNSKKDSLHFPLTDPHLLGIRNNTSVLLFIIIYSELYGR